MYSCVGCGFLWVFTMGFVYFGLDVLWVLFAVYLFGFVLVGVLGVGFGAGVVCLCVVGWGFVLECVGYFKFLWLGL